MGHTVIVQGVWFQVKWTTEENQRRVCTHQSVIDLAPPTIRSVHIFQPVSTLLVKGLATPTLLEIWLIGKVQTGISVLGVLPPSDAGKTEQCLFMKKLTKGNSFSHKSLMATPTQRMQLRYVHAQPPLEEN